MSKLCDIKHIFPFSVSYLERMHRAMDFQDLRHDIHRGSEGLRQ